MLIRKAIYPGAAAKPCRLDADTALALTSARERLTFSVVGERDTASVRAATETARGLPRKPRDGTVKHSFHLFFLLRILL
jgi:hypothetical protein